MRAFTDNLLHALALVYANMSMVSPKVSVSFAYLGKLDSYAITAYRLAVGVGSTLVLCGVFGKPIAT